MRSIILALLVMTASNLSAETFAIKANGLTNGLGAGGTVYSTWGFMY